MKEIGFRTWKKTWRRARLSFLKKCKLVDLRGTAFLSEYGPYVDTDTGYGFPSNLSTNPTDINRVVYNIIPPHKYFTDTEKAIWRNIMNWMFRDDDEEWIDFPGPAAWWESYNEEEHGFTVPTDGGYEEAFFMLSEPIEPPRFKLVLETLQLSEPSQVKQLELQVVEETAED
jgi:hypothetical protein